MASSDILEYKNVLESTDSSDVQKLNALNALERIEITADTIRTTKIGVPVGKLRKSSSNNKVSSACELLVERWKRVIEQTKTSSPSTSTTSSPAPDKRKEALLDSTSKRKAESKAEDERESLKITIKRAKNDSDEDAKSKKKKASGEDGSVREKITGILSEALGSDNDYALDPADVASEIERELFKKFGGVSTEYKAKVRSLSFNLKKNVDLRSTVMQGAKSAAELCNMTTAEMASDKLKEERQKWAEYQKQAAMASGGAQTSTDMFKCGKCGRRETTYYQMQTRSADEPMTTFHTCVKCGHRWKS